MLYHAITAIIAAVLIGELLKIATQLARNEPVKPFHLGGMPSTHAAAVAALCVDVLAETGVSILLLITIVFGWIVARDACGVRWEVTRHSAALNKQLGTKTYEVTGHTPAQVFAGLALGIVVTMLVYALL